MQSVTSAHTCELWITIHSHLVSFLAKPLNGHSRGIYSRTWSTLKNHSKRWISIGHHKHVLKVCNILKAICIREIRDLQLKSYRLLHGLYDISSFVVVYTLQQNITCDNILELERGKKTWANCYSKSLQVIIDFMCVYIILYYIWFAYMVYADISQEMLTKWGKENACLIKYQSSPKKISRPWTAGPSFSPPRSFTLWTTSKRAVYYLALTPLIIHFIQFVRFSDIMIYIPNKEFCIRNT